MRGDLIVIVVMSVFLKVLKQWFLAWKRFAFSFLGKPDTHTSWNLSCKPFFFPVEPSTRKFQWESPFFKRDNANRRKTPTRDLSSKWMTRVFGANTAICNRAAALTKQWSKHVFHLIPLSPGSVVQLELQASSIVFAWLSYENVLYWYGCKYDKNCEVAEIWK